MNARSSDTTLSYSETSFKGNRRFIDNQSYARFKISARAPMRLGIDIDDDDDARVRKGSACSVTLALIRRLHVWNR